MLKFRVSSISLGFTDSTIEDFTSWKKLQKKAPLGLDWREVKSNIHKTTVANFLHKIILNLEYHTKAIRANAKVSSFTAHQLLIAWEGVLGQAKSKGEISSYELHLFRDEVKQKITVCLNVLFIEARYPIEEKPAVQLVASHSLVGLSTTIF